MKRTFEGATAVEITAEQALRRSVLSCMLWEDTFYENGESIAQRIETTIPLVDPAVVASLAVEAREKFKLRSVPLLLAKGLAGVQRGSNLVSKTLARIIQRPDELTKFLEIYWMGGKKPLSAQIKKGLALAFNKFDAYQLAKYNRDGNIKLRDVMLLTHPKPKDVEQSTMWKSLLDKTLASPDTWEVRLSSGADKKQSWEELLTQNKMGALAVLKNLRNFQRDDVDPDIIKQALGDLKTERVLPFRFLTAARYAGTEYLDYLEKAMFKCIDTKQKLSGKTILLVDVSGSMDGAYGKRSSRAQNYWSTERPEETAVTMIDIACGLAILLREICDNVEVYSFSDYAKKVERTRGFKLKDSINDSQRHNGTSLGKALTTINRDEETYDRLIVITDEQSSDNISNFTPKGKAYLINVASYVNGIGYGDNWIHLDGFSEAVIDWIQQYEPMSDNGWRSTIEKILLSEF
jgi:60 kDa SS-A/Ro ribonucleoprotein